MTDPQIFTKKKTKILTLYNHKGGVSKTTTNFNLAHLLADSGYKVLAVDADPQCNLTELMMVNQINEADDLEVASGVEQFLPGSTILDILKPRISGDLAEIDVNSAELVEINENLSLLRGDVSLSDIEDSLSEAHIQRFSNKIHEKRTYVALSHFLRKIGEKNSFDYIIIDVGPSSGSLTRACFLCCDYFFVPTVPDRFNVQAIGTLSAILSRWINEHSQIYEDFLKLGLPVPLGKPAFLGAILQNYKIFSGEPKKSFKLWMERIPKKIESDLLPALKKFSSDKKDLTSGINISNCIVSKIPDFAGLAPLLQETGKPIFSITPEDTKKINSGQPYAGKVWTQAEERMKNYKAQLSMMMDRLI
jgi:cellulose biosynthesis protein BcsQ